jgi:toxin ParE1/3/4
MIWDVQYTEIAEKDLQEIYDYIAYELLVPSTAEKQTNRIMDTADSLNHMPLRHRLCDYEPWRSMGWRLIPIDNYIVFYLPVEDNHTVFIMRIIYGRRDIETHL